MVQEFLVTEQQAVMNTTYEAESEESPDNNRNALLYRKRKTFILEKVPGAMMIKATDSIKMKWDVFIMLLATFNCFTIPLNVAF